jgi:uncharacterized protein
MDSLAMLQPLAPQIIMSSRSFPKSNFAPFFILFFALCVLGVCVSAQQAKDLKPQGYVDDFAAVLGAEAKDKLTTLCGEVDHKANAQIAVVTVPSLKGEPIEQFSVDLATRWGVGPKQAARGVLILLAPNEHKYRIEVGYGLEAILPDGKVGGFGREAVPLLRQNDYDGALLLMTQRVASVIAQDKGVTLDSLSQTPASEVRPGRSSWNPSTIIWIIFVGFFVILPLLRLVFRSRFGGGPYSRRRSGISWAIGPWIGGGWGGGGFSGGGSFGGGGGFGGFGGGSFGGGGASGSW